MGGAESNTETETEREKGKERERECVEKENDDVMKGFILSICFSRAKGRDRSDASVGQK